MLLPPLGPSRADGNADEGAAENGPVGFVAGAIDLLYRDPATGQLVVADYKTDPVDTGPALAARVEGYRTQGETYVRAVRDALGLNEDPRFELWFLHPGRVEAL